MSSIPVIWSNDDITFGQTTELQRQLDFLAEFDVPGTFFVVPIRSIGTIDQDEALKKTMLSAQQSGHTFHQHGTAHDAFECGFPESWMLKFSEKEEARYHEHKDELEAGHTVPALRAMLKQGQEIWSKVFGAPSLGFRPGWGSYCDNLYKALDAEGFEWVSSRVLCRTSWMWNNGHWDEPMVYRKDIPLQSQKRYGDLWEIPMTGGDYAFQVPDQAEKINAMVDLALQEYAFCQERQLPFVIVSHWHGLEKNNGSGYKVHRELLRQLKQESKAEFMTLDDLYQHILIKPKREKCTHEN